MLAKTCLVKTDVAGMSWEAKIEREKPNYFICKLGWPQFVVYHKLEIGDVLFFFLIDKSRFHVLPYSQKCSRNLRGGQPFEELSCSSEEEEEGEGEGEEVEEAGENIEASRKSKKAKMEPVELSDSEEQIVDPSGGSKDAGNPCYSHLSNLDLFLCTFGYI
ncbi:hypothetical protein HAX54_013271 [Datura stramonium]|uniref:TF-B3 domain-containing protein n=1 Tax=Datura stramonium TaxID=4076 RepID=A0ABS8TMZ0_DATST|nr:hypothetical protein [Datura stramonium]